MKNLAFTNADGCFVLVQSKESSTMNEWREWLAFLLQEGEALKDKIRVLVVTAGASPTPAQRALMREVIPPGGEARIAILLDSRFGRAILGAMGRFNSQIKGFAPHDVSEAMEYLRLSSSTRQTVLEEVRRLHRELDLPCEL